MEEVTIPATKKEGRPHRFKQTYDPEEILKVLPAEGELKTATIKKRLSELNELYAKPSKEWYRKALDKLVKAGMVEKVKKEDDIADVRARYAATRCYRAQSAIGLQGTNAFSGS